MIKKKCGSIPGLNPIELIQFTDNNKNAEGFLLQPGRKYSNRLVWQNYKYQTNKLKTDLYRFLRDNIPLLHACIWTWSRLSSAPGRFEIIETDSEKISQKAKHCAVFADRSGLYRNLRKSSG